MKKFLIILLSILMFSVSGLFFTACGDEQSTEQPQQEQPKDDPGEDPPAPQVFVEALEFSVPENADVSLADGLSLKVNDVDVPCYSVENDNTLHSFATALVTDEQAFPLTLSVVSENGFTSPVAMPSLTIESVGKAIQFTVNDYGIFTVTDVDNLSFALTITVRAKEEYSLPEGYTEVVFKAGEHFFKTQSETDYFLKDISSSRLFVNNIGNLYTISGTVQSQSVYPNVPDYYTKTDDSYVLDASVTSKNFNAKKSSLYVIEALSQVEEDFSDAAVYYTLTDGKYVVDTDVTSENFDDIKASLYVISETSQSAAAYPVPQYYYIDNGNYYENNFVTKDNFDAKKDSIYVITATAQTVTPFSNTATYYTKENNSYNVAEITESNYNYYVGSLYLITAMPQSEEEFSADALYYTFDAGSYDLDMNVTEDNFDNKKDTLYLLEVSYASGYDPDEKYYSVTTGNYSGDETDEKVIRKNSLLIFKKGVHEINGTVNLTNNTSVFFEDGAYVLVKNATAPAFSAQSINGAKFYGNAIVDFASNASFFYSDGSVNVSVNDLTIINFANIALDMQYSRFSAYNSVLISLKDGSKGISCASLANSTVEDSLLRSSDNTLEFFIAHTNQGGNFDNVTVSGVTAISDSAAAVDFEFDENRQIGSSALLNTSDNIVIKDSALVTLSALDDEESGALIIDIQKNNLINNVTIQNVAIYSTAKYGVNVFSKNVYDKDNIVKSEETDYMDGITAYTYDQRAGGANPLENLTLENVVLLSDSENRFNAETGFTVTKYDQDGLLSVAIIRDIESYKVTFEGEHFTANVYEDEYAVEDGTFTAAPFAIATFDGETATDGTGRVIFNITADENYAIKSITLTPGERNDYYLSYYYIQVLSPLSDGVYVIEGIVRDLTVTVECELIA